MEDIPSNAIPSEEYFTKNAFLLFIDIKNSSTYGQYFPLGVYVNLVKSFKKIFTQVINVMKENFVELTNEYICNIQQRGDEGFVCLIVPDEINYELLAKLVRKILSYLHILKILLFKDTMKQTKNPIDIAVGIHYGEVAKVKDEIYGYSINYTKRIESESRNSRYTGIFVSKPIKDLLRNSDVIFDNHLCNISGMNKNEVIYEIQYSFINIYKELNDKEREAILLLFRNLQFEGNEDIKIHDALLLSLYYFFIQLKLEEEQYEKKLNNMIWHNIYEKNPTILLLRAKQYENEAAKDPDAYLSAIRYYKQALLEYPNYTRAAVHMARLINKMNTFCRSEISEITAIAHDLLGKFTNILNDDYRTEIEQALKAVKDCNNCNKDL